MGGQHFHPLLSSTLQFNLDKPSLFVATQSMAVPFIRMYKLVRQAKLALYKRGRENYIETANVTVGEIQDRHERLRELHVPAVSSTGQTVVRSPRPLQLCVRPALRLISALRSALTHTTRELT